MTTFETIEYGTCPSCGYRMLPVLDLLPCGHDGPTITAPLDVPGTVYSWTRAWTGEEARVLAMVDFFDGALRVTAPVLDVDEVEIGATVHAIAGRTTPYAFRAGPPEQ